MLVTEITTERNGEQIPFSPKFTKEQLQGECDFRVAEIILKKMLDEGKITPTECTILTKESAKIFSPILAELSCF